MDKKDFIAIYEAETQDYLTRLDKGLVELEKDPDNLELITELNRAAHTLKGSARVFGFYEIQEIAHRIEDIFEKVSQKRLVFSPQVADRIFKGLDVVRGIAEKIVKEERIDVDISETCKELEQCFSAETESEEDKPQTEVRRQRTKNKEPKKETGKQQYTKTGNPKSVKSSAQAGEEIKKAPKKVPLKETQSSASEDIQKLTPPEEYIRVPLSRVNKLLNLVGEMVINKMKSSAKIARAKRLFTLSKQVQKRISGLGETIKKNFPSEDTEAAKLFSQCDTDIQRLKEDALGLYDNISTEAFHLDPVIDELQARMKEIRMLPCATIFEGFPRMVRDIASQEAKEINLEISGEGTELDKKILEGIKTPLMHILRNCIDHGIETPEKRIKLDKPRIGTIKLSAYHEAGNVIIAIEDDGRGIDVDEIKQTVLKKHLVPNEELEVMTEKEILNLVFMNGFSTSPIITDVSGRGIGLDIVRRDIGHLKGRVILDARKDKGTNCTLILPLTIAIIQVLLIKSQGILFALPVSSIEESLKVNMEEVSTIEGKMAIQVRGHAVPVVRLDEVLGLPETQLNEDNQQKSMFPVVIANSLDKHVGFIIDEIIGEEEIFIKSLGEHLGKIKNVSGATILGTGEVVVILDVADLVDQSRLSHPAVAVKKPSPENMQKAKRILVVEDALSTRELEKSILETHGYHVDTAVNGLDGLDRITQGQYDLVVSDIKMPRMDGFEFCKTLKKNDEYKDIPVVMVTSMEKEEDKRRGIEVGASAYIIKRVFDQGSLLDTIERLIG